MWVRCGGINGRKGNRWGMTREMSRGWVDGRQGMEQESV